MTIPNLTEDEFIMLNEILDKHRAEAAKQKAIEHEKHCISFAISAAIGKIGLTETKRIIRELNAELRKFDKEDDN